MATVYLVQHTHVGPFEKGDVYVHSGTPDEFKRLVRLGAIAPKVRLVEVTDDAEPEENAAPSASELSKEGIIVPAGSEASSLAQRAAMDDRPKDMDGDGAVDDYEQMTLADLRKLGADAGIEGAAGKTKADLAAALKDAAAKKD